MRYAITLNLDYSSHPQGQVKALFQLLRTRLLEAGFRQDGRLFTIEMPSAEASVLAKNVLESAAEEGEFGDIYAYVKEFYGFNFDTATNFLLPPSMNIDVVDVSDTDLEYIDLKPPSAE